MISRKQPLNPNPVDTKSGHPLTGISEGTGFIAVEQRLSLSHVTDIACRA